MERWDFEFLTTLTGTPNPNPAAGEMAADALPADVAVLMPAPATITPGRGGGSAGREECRRRWEECLAEDEETKFRSEAAKLHFDGWMASRIESAEKSTRGGDPKSHAPTGAASSSAPAAAAGGSGRRQSLGAVCEDP